MNEQQIYDPTGDFNFAGIKLSPPTVVSGTQFIKLKMNNSSLLIQSPKCLTKQGIITEKKKTADLVFTSDDDEIFIKWIDTLELHCQKAIFNNRHEWFGKEWVNDINDLSDVENYFRNTVKPFKGSRYYSMAVSIPPDLKIYDENEEEIDSDKIIGEQTNIVCILEFEGIKCNLSNFQIQVKVRQMMTILPIFSKCLIKKNNTLGNNGGMSQKTERSSATFSDISVKEIDGGGDCGVEIVSASVETNSGGKDVGSISLGMVGGTKIMTGMPESVSEFAPMMEEMNLKVDDSEDVVELKDRKSIIMDLYRTAKDKAKKARHLALMAYLEKNQIKNTYMLEDMESDDEDSELYE